MDGRQTDGPREPVQLTGNINSVRNGTFETPTVVFFYACVYTYTMTTCGNDEILPEPDLEIFPFHSSIFKLSTNNLTPYLHKNVIHKL